MKRQMTTVVLAAATALLAQPAFAHPGHSGTTDFLAGFQHPVSGLDHLLAMALVGVLTSRLGGRALWIVPATFLVFLAAGAALGMAGLTVPGLEVTLVLSVVALAISAATSAGLSISGAVALAATAAVVHGAAHGVELPAAAAALPFALGFLASSTVLLIIGLAAGQLLPAQGRVRLATGDSTG